MPGSRGGRRGAGALAACVLAAGALTLTARGDHRPPAATLPGFAVSDDRLNALVAAVDVGAVPVQFTPGEVAAHVLTELLDLQIDTRLAAALGVTPDLATARRLTAAGAARAGGLPAFQQQLLRNPGAGWAGAGVYEQDQVLQGQLAAVEARRLQPVPAATLQQAYTARLGDYAHAHVQILTTHDLGTATADAQSARADPAGFPALVRRDTDDDTHRASGGDYGPALAKGQLFRAVDDAIFASAPADILGPITVEESPPEYYVVRVLSVTDTPLSAATPSLTAELLQPGSSYVQAALLEARRRQAVGVTVRADLGSWDATDLSVRP